jgi:hypothetical protein
MGAPVPLPIAMLQIIWTHRNDGNDTSYEIARGSSGFRGFLAQKELKTLNIWSEPHARCEPVFNCCSGLCRTARARNRFERTGHHTPSEKRTPFSRLFPHAAAQAALPARV